MLMSGGATNVKLRNLYLSICFLLYLRSTGLHLQAKAKVNIDVQVKALFI